MTNEADYFVFFHLVLHLPGSVNIELAHRHQLPQVVKPCMRWSLGFQTRLVRRETGNLPDFQVFQDVLSSVKHIVKHEDLQRRLWNQRLCGFFQDCCFAFLLIYQLQAGGPRGLGDVKRRRALTAARGLVRCRVWIYELTNWDMIRHDFPISSNFKITFLFHPFPISKVWLGGSPSLSMIVGSALGL